MRPTTRTSVPFLLGMAGVVLLAVPPGVLAERDGPGFTHDALRWCGALLVVLAPMLAMAIHRGVAPRGWPAAVTGLVALLTLTRDPLWLFPLVVTCLGAVASVGMSVLYDAYGRYSSTIMDGHTPRRRRADP